MRVVKSRIADSLARLSVRARAALSHARALAGAFLDRPADCREDGQALSHARALVCAFAPVGALALAASLLGGCSGGCSRAPEPESPAPFVDRMHDPEYVAKLQEKLKVQKEITSRASAVRQELEAARKEDPESAKTKELEAKFQSIGEELEKERRANMSIIRSRMHSEIADSKKAGNAKGEKGAANGEK